MRSDEMEVLRYWFLHDSCLLPVMLGEELALGSFDGVMYSVVNSLSDAVFFSVMVSSPFTSVLFLMGEIPRCV